MALTRKQKQERLAIIKDRLKRNKTTVFTSFTGLSVKQQEELRNSLREINAEYSVVKKTLLNLALKDKNIDVAENVFPGQVSMIFDYTSQTEGAKRVKDFSKKNEALQILGGLFNNEFISKDKVIELALLPSLDQLRAQLVQIMNVPIRGFVRVLSGAQIKFLNVLNQIKDNKA
ncbi:MAG: 50S ribosomal protein L10 [Parcubacteria group bacterium GW2011_GWA2_31_28]|nr:MAG: 50S ribosomal protein L10 [Parcubacteria group bacterium GW2011_GWA2_31_28]